MAGLKDGRGDMAFQEPCRDPIVSAGQVLGRAQGRGERGSVRGSVGE